MKTSKQKRKVIDRKSLFNNARRYNRFMIAVSVFPVIFVFGLPGFQRLGPEYFNYGNSTTGNVSTIISISGFISRAPATGLMFLFFLPVLMQMWLLPLPQQLETERNWSLSISAICLLLFQLFFGLFLAIPNIYWSAAHGAVVGLFCLFGIIYCCFQIYFITKYPKTQKEKTWQKFIIPLGFIGMGITGLGILAYANIMGKLGKPFNYGFWLWESIGLSGIALFPHALMIEFHDDHRGNIFHFNVYILGTPLYYGAFFKEPKMKQRFWNTFGTFMSFLATCYILSLPYLASIGYASKGNQTSNVDSTNHYLSISEYLSGNKVNRVAHNKQVEGGKTGAATGAMVSFLFFPIFILWRLKPKALKEELVFDFLWAKKVFILLFFICFTLPYGNDMCHRWVHYLSMVATGWYFFIRFKNTQQTKLNWFAFMWNFLSCIFYLINFAYNDNAGTHHLSFYVQASYYISIIWTVPIEILNGGNIYYHDDFECYYHNNEFECYYHKEIEIPLLQSSSEKEIQSNMEANRKEDNDTNEYFIVNGVTYDIKKAQDDIKKAQDLIDQLQQKIQQQTEHNKKL